MFLQSGHSFIVEPLSKRSLVLSLLQFSYLPQKMCHPDNFGPVWIALSKKRYKHSPISDPISSFSCYIKQSAQSDAAA